MNDIRAKFSALIGQSIDIGTVPKIPNYPDVEPDGKVHCAGVLTEIVEDKFKDGTNRTLAVFDWGMGIYIDETSTWEKFEDESDSRRSSDARSPGALTRYA